MVWISGFYSSVAKVTVWVQVMWAGCSLLSFPRFHIYFASLMEPYNISDRVCRWEVFIWRYVWGCVYFHAFIVRLLCFQKFLSSLGCDCSTGPLCAGSIFRPLGTGSLGTELFPCHACILPLSLLYSPGLSSLVVAFNLSACFSSPSQEVDANYALNQLQFSFLHQTFLSCVPGTILGGQRPKNFPS